MSFENMELELGRIAKAFRAISRETSYGGLARALLDSAMQYCGAKRGAVLLSERTELLVKADANFPRELAKIFVVQPPGAFNLPEDLTEQVLTQRQTVVRNGRWQGSALSDRAKRDKGPDLAMLYLPLVSQERTIGVLYLEGDRCEDPFAPMCVSVLSMLASQAAVSFESAQLFEALRETNMWMVKGQQIGRMGSYRWNTRTQLSRGSRECYAIFDLDLDLNPVPYKAFAERVHHDDLPALEHAIADALSTRFQFSHEYRIVHRNGKVLQVIAVGQFDVGPSGDLELEGIITDITERKAGDQALTDARAELARGARLASLGELAGSIIHEVNQPLTGILASAEACLRWLTRDPVRPAEASKSAMRIVEQGRRAADVVAGLRSLVREKRLELVDVPVNDMVEEILLLSRRELERGGVTLRRDFDPSAPHIKADRVQLQQVVLNLVRNAIDAMAEVSERPRVLTASSKVVDGQVSVTISDTGIGIDLSRRERLFDALYTTKGEGLGLGLSICRKIIDAHEGLVWAAKNASHGATFTFTLPLHQKDRRSATE